MFLNPAQSNIKPLKDESMLQLAEHIFGGNSCGAATAAPPKTGWPRGVSDVAALTYAGKSTPEAYPFIVGGVCCNDGDGYGCMLLVQHAVEAWCAIACDETLAAAAVSVTRAIEAASRIVAPIDTSLHAAIGQLAQMNADIAAASSSIAAYNAMVADPTLQMPAGCLGSNLVLDTGVLLGRCLLHYLRQLSVKLEGDDFDGADLNDALGWYTEVSKTAFAFSDDELAVVNTVRGALEAAQATNLMLEASTTAAAQLAAWRNA